MQNAKLLLVDADAYTSEVLIEDLEDRGYASITRIENSLAFPADIADSEFDLVIFNYHFHDSSSLLNCNAIKTILPKTSLVVIASTGPAIKNVRAWAEKTGVIDVVVEKPLSDERFFLMIGDLVKAHQTAATLQKRADRLANIVPEAALNAVDSDSKVLNEAEMNEAAVLFTDIRGSSEAILNLAPRDFFKALNNTLSIQSKIIREHEGAIVKYTGDGVMAIFKGMGRSHLALRAGMALAKDSQTANLPYGVGVAEGLVLSGLIGDANHAGQRQQYDVIGATVHLAARLCSTAQPSELIATRNVYNAAHLQTPNAREIGLINVRGFEEGVHCIAFQPNTKI
ncbi:MAG: adenylate/guanylate cyclase domain-containing response regulator [Methylophilaceae bacterium]|nr:adenylate/guanylate cyclase domain-containing response regulator [Methylophilaceae bacterium]